MEPKAIYEKLQATFGDAVTEYRGADTGAAPDKGIKDPYCFVRPEKLHEVMRYLRDDPELGFDFLDNLTGVDWPDKKAIHVVYHMFSYDKRHRMGVKVSLDRAAPAVATVEDLWPVAGWHEREAYDLLGVKFEGHGDLRRVLLPDDWEGHPLRKDFVEKGAYHGIPTTRPNPLELFKISLPKDAPAKADAAAAAKAPAPEKKA